MTLCIKCKMLEKTMAAGDGFREFTCALCGKHDIWHNTNIPKFCYSCSKKLNICQRCGKILDEEKK